MGLALFSLGCLVLLAGLIIRADYKRRRSERYLDPQAPRTGVNTARGTTPPTPPRPPGGEGNFGITGPGL